MERMMQKASEPPTARKLPVTLSLTFTGRTWRSVGLLMILGSGMQSVAAVL